MNKISALRKHLLGLAHLNLVDDQFHTFIENQGKAISYPSQPKNTGLGADIQQCSPTSNYNFKLEYAASIVVTDYRHDFNVLAYEVIQWLDKFEVYRATDHTALEFKADIIKNDVYDVEITIKLTDIVKVSQQEGGVSIATHDCERVQL